MVRGEGAPQLRFPGFRDMRGYRAMYGDFVRAIREAGAPEMSLEAAMDDQRLMDQIYASLRTQNLEPRTVDPMIADPRRIHVQ
jgi:predicted dehydrogenase